LRVNHSDYSWVADVCVNAVAHAVVEGPARPARQAELGDRPFGGEIDDRCRAVLSDRLTEIERVKTPAPPVVGESVRVRADLDLAQ
jgi:hypothetical protein